MCPWKRRSQRKKRMSSPCTKSTMMLSSPWTLWRPSTHMMTHEGPWIFEMWSWSQEHALGQVLLLPHGVYKELTCEFLASMRYHMYEEDRAELDQGLGWITFLARERRR
ncbi:unnamed protein product [Microthlaspi erraticum]|uniref:Arabidopsis retrotransposon Orf1 C-terminal domain-containing protein n=1 Tax=Microthlaspi erraticum TaxID=1685480 RepID=A0A6D2I656_9BRAS|nr:unnamed protein product [Microthlaspi erraticum]